MRGLVQRVRSAKVTVGGSTEVVGPQGGDGSAGVAAEAGVGGPAEVVGEIAAGILLLVGVTHDDTAADAEKLADKVWNLRVFDDSDGVMNLSVADTSQAVLVVSQFTLYGDTRRGRRPGYSAAARPEQAEPLVAAVADALRARGATVQTGRFGAEMLVQSVNDGPVTLIIDT